MQWWRKPIEIPRNACKCARIKINDMFSWIILVAVPGIVLEVPSGGIRACYLSRRVLHYQNVIRPIQNDLSMSSHYWTMLPLKSKKGTIKQVLPISLPMSTIIKMRVFVSTNPCPYPIKFHSTATVSLERPRLNKGIRAEKMFLAGFSQGPLVEHEWFTRGGVANVGEPEETTYRGSQGVWLLIVGRCWEKWLSKDVKPYLHLGFDHVRPICWSQLHVIPVEIVWLDVYIYIYIIYDCKAYTWCLRVPTYIHMRYLWPLIMTLVWMRWHDGLTQWDTNHSPKSSPSRWRFIALHGLISGLPIGWHSVYVRRLAITVSQVLTWKGRWLGICVAEHGDFQNV